MNVLARIEDENPETYQENMAWDEYVSILLQQHGEVRVAHEPRSSEHDRLPLSFYVISENPSVADFLELGERILAWLCPSTMRFRTQETVTPHGVCCNLHWDVRFEDGHSFRIWGTTPDRYSRALSSGTAQGCRV
jgi:hypothetical protein